MKGTRKESKFYDLNSPASSNFQEKTRDTRAGNELPRSRKSAAKLIGYKRGRKMDLATTDSE